MTVLHCLGSSGRSDLPYVRRGHTGRVRVRHPRKGASLGPDHDPLSTGGAHSQSGPLGPKTQEPVTGRRKSLSYIQPAHRTPLSGTLLISAGHVSFLHGILTRPSAWGHMNFD